jgi:hypothetical protein
MIPNPEYEDWDALDQQVLSYLLGSLSKEILSHVSNCATYVEAWTAIEGVFTSHTRARTVNIRLALRTTRKGNLSAMDYFSKMKALSDEMAAAGRPLDDEELIEYIITGLDEEYTPLVSAICARVEPISLSEFYSQFLSFETHVALLQDGQNRTVNATTRGGGARSCGSPGMRGRGGPGDRGPSPGRDGFGRDRGGQNRGSFYNIYGGHQKYNNDLMCQSLLQEEPHDCRVLAPF